MDAPGAAGVHESTSLRREKPEHHTMAEDES